MLSGFLPAPPAREARYPLASYAYRFPFSYAYRKEREASLSKLGAFCPGVTYTCLVNGQMRGGRERERRKKFPSVKGVFCWHSQHVIASILDDARIDHLIKLRFLLLSPCCEDYSLDR
jgi:hypothetical protein